MKMLTNERSIRKLFTRSTRFTRSTYFCTAPNSTYQLNFVKCLRILQFCFQNFTCRPSAPSRLAVHDLNCDRVPCTRSAIRSVHFLFDFLGCLLNPCATKEKKRIVCNCCLKFTNVDFRKFSKFYQKNQDLLDPQIS